MNTCLGGDLGWCLETSPLYNVKLSRAEVKLSRAEQSSIGRRTGATQLTEMRRGANSLAAALLYCSVAACAPMYTEYSGTSRTPSWLLSSLQCEKVAPLTTFWSSTAAMVHHMNMLYITSRTPSWDAQQPVQPVFRCCQPVLEAHQETKDLLTEWHACALM